MDDDERFDGLYLNVAQTTQGIEPLLDTVFSFLRRKTDFFDGPPGSGDAGTQVAIDKVQQVVQKHAALYTQKKAAETKKKATTTAPPKKSLKTTATAAASSVIEMDPQGGFDISETKEAPVVPPKNTDETKPAPAQDPTTPDSGTVAPPPVGNGGTVPGKYSWTQTLAEVTVTIPVPEHTRGRDLNVTIAKQHVKVGLRKSAGPEWIVQGRFVHPIICDDSFWTIEDGNRLVMNLQKLNQMEWWDAVLDDDPKIDIKRIQPENSSLNDLDGETRQTVGTSQTQNCLIALLWIVNNCICHANFLDLLLAALLEKMMFDQRQKAMGLPSSDEQRKLDMLEKFKAQHPEMDFSQAKIN